jgi:hypothetical protein
MGKPKKQTYIIDLERLNTLNEEGCPACGKKFNLGETAVMACGAWDGGAKLIHENEAVYDARTASYVERRCFEANRDR